MLRSKALKRFKNLSSEMGILWAIQECTIWPIQSFYHRMVERIGRSIAFARIAWLNYDFDSATVWDLLAFKYKRILKCLENGHAIQEDEDMNALRELIAICERMYADNYDEVYYDGHNAKYGDLVMDSTEVATRDKDGNPKSYYLKMTRPGVTPANEAQERIDFLATMENAEADRQKDMDRYCEIIKKHHRTWWD